MYTPADLMAAVQRSPDAVAVHDKAAWMSMYSRTGVVEDPVGSKPHRGIPAIAKFYDTFIAPNTINFHPHQDIVSGMSVVRDLTLETIMSTGATLHVPMHLRYDLVDEGGELRIARLAAHWELSAMVGQLLRAGIKGLAASVKLTPQLVANQGMAGALGFMGGLRSVGTRGKVAALDALRNPQCPVKSASGETRPVDVLRGANYRKLLAAGRTISATAELESGAGVVFVEFSSRSSSVDSITVFEPHGIS